MAALRLGDIAPDFTQDSSEGPISLRSRRDKAGRAVLPPAPYTGVHQ